MGTKTARAFTRGQIYDIATQYANSSQEYSRSYFSMQYNISYSTFYKLLERAVVENIVDESIVRKMATKAENNALKKAGEGARKRSENHYKYLLLKRKAFMLPKEDTKSMAITYASSPLVKKDFCKSNFIDTKLFDKMLCKAIIENWITDEVVSKIKDKAIQNNSNEKTTAFWEQLLKFRNENKKNQG